MRRAPLSGLLAAGVVILALPCSAQTTYTTAQLQALAAADAAAAGVPTDLFLAQIQAESNFDPAAHNPSGATGIAQFLPSSAADLGYGIPSFNPNDPVASLSAAAQYDKALYAANGDSWTAALTAYSGGLTPTAPADYGPVFALAQAADNAGTAAGVPVTGVAGSSGITITGTPDSTGITVNGNPAASTSLAAAAQAAGVTASVGSTFNPFSFLYSLYQNAITQPINNEVMAIQSAIQPGVNYILIIMIAVIGIGVMTDKIGMGEYMSRIMRAGFVVTMLFVGSLDYNQYIVQPFSQLPLYFAQQILGSTSTNPAAGFDAAMHSFNGYASNSHWNIIFDTSEAIESISLFIVAVFVFYGALAVIFGAWFIAQVLTQLMFLVGSIFVLCFLFDFTRPWFARWVGELAHQAVVTLGLDILGALLLKVIGMAFQMGSNAPAGVQQFENLLGVAVVAGILAFTVPVFWRVIGQIFAAAGVPAIAGPRRFLTAAAGAAMGGAGRAVGAAAGAVRAIPGSSSPPGRSLSRS